MLTLSSTVRSRASVATLEARASSVPDALAAYDRQSVVQALAPIGPATHRRWVITGIGGSEGPARLLAGVLNALGIAARFAPISAFLENSPPAADGLVIVSQKLSPNARIALRRSRAYPACIVITSVDPAASPTLGAMARDGVAIVCHGPPDEDGLFLRVLGPTLACRAALDVAEVLSERGGGSLPEWSGALSRLPSDATRAWSTGLSAPPMASLTRAAFITLGDDAELVPVLRTKLLEGLGVDAPSWDALGLVHGPLQSFFDDARLLFFLAPAAPSNAEPILARLRAVLDEHRHPLVVVPAELPSPLSLFEYASAFDKLVVSALKAHPRDLAAWPGQGHDGPLYDLEKAP